MMEFKKKRLIIKINRLSDSDNFKISKKQYEKEKAKHLPYLAKEDFVIDIPLKSFTANDILHLKKLGHWYTALQNGEIEPIEKCHKKLINQLQGYEKGIEEFGSIWLKYQQEIKKWGELYSILKSSESKDLETLQVILDCKSCNRDDTLDKLIGYSTGLFEISELNSYNQILEKITKKLDIKGNFTSSKEYERAISVKVLEAALSKMNEEQKKKLEVDIIKISKTEKGINYKAGVALATLTAANVSGFGVYLLATTSLSTLSGIIGITLPFVAYTTLTSAISLIIGPVGWIGLGAFTLWKMSETNYNKLILAVIYIHWLREKYLESVL